MRKGVVCALALLSLTAPTGALTQERQSTAFTLQSGQERTNEQTAVRFDQADLSIKVIPDQRRIEGVAVLDFTATTETILTVLFCSTEIMPSVRSEAMAMRLVRKSPCTSSA